jgi:hypothetical protein
LKAASLYGIRIGTWLNSFLQTQSALPRWEPLAIGRSAHIKKG